MGSYMHIPTLFLVNCDIPSDFDKKKYKIIEDTNDVDLEIDKYLNDVTRGDNL